MDASGWFALLNRTEGAAHQKANALFARHARGMGVVTTEYVLQETATLLRSHSLPHIEGRLFAFVENTTRVRVVWSSFRFFTRTRDFFLKHHDKDWSFVDCSSFLLMNDEGLSDALSTDKRFKQAGFMPLLKA